MNIVNALCWALAFSPVVGALAIGSAMWRK